MTTSDAICNRHIDIPTVAATGIPPAPIDGPVQELIRWNAQARAVLARFDAEYPDYVPAPTPPARDDLPAELRRRGPGPTGATVSMPTRATRGAPTGDRLRAWRLELHLTQRAAAELAGISRRTVHAIETRHRPDRDRITRTLLATAYATVEARRSATRVSARGTRDALRPLATTIERSYRP
jgi:DNA-binding XRE family transcriptional regulator